MTLDELKRTRWWKGWLRETRNPPSELLIDTALRDGLIVVIVESLGEWNIYAWNEEENRYGPFLDSTKKERGALLLCKRMGWKVKGS